MEDNISVGAPLSNRGVQPTIETSYTLSIDWLSCTFDLDTGFEEVLTMLHLDLDMFVLQDYTFYGYKSLMEYNGITLLVGHKDRHFMLDISGSGCRFLESVNFYTYICIFFFFKGI